MTDAPNAPDGGLTAGEAARRLEADGPNVPPRLRRISAWRELFAQFTHLLAALLWLAAGLALVAGTPALSAAIVCVIVFNAAFAFAQEYRADRSAERLRALMPVEARVRRDGQLRTVDASELVRGDLVVLRPGDRIAADMMVARATSLRVDEALITGESEPTPRTADEPLSAGTFVVQGEGEAIVTATGVSTTLAEISVLAGAARRPVSPLKRELNRVVRVVAIIATVTGFALSLTAIGLGLQPAEAFLFGVGVAVALVPEGLLPTVTLALARGAQLMAGRQALVRRLDAVETLGAVTFICTDKTGTLTQNQMSVVEVWTLAGTVAISGSGYDPTARITGPPAARALLPEVASAVLPCIVGRTVLRECRWCADGDPLEAAIWCLAVRCGVEEASGPVTRFPYTADRMMSSAMQDTRVSVLGAPEHVLARCTAVSPAAHEALAAMVGRGRRVLAVAVRERTEADGSGPDERELTLVGLVGLEDPPRPDVAESLRACREADIRVIMVTGDHPRTAEAIAREVGLLQPGGVVLGPGLPSDDAELGDMLDRAEGAVVARVTPADKLRVARVLQARGHVVAMTGDGVNDAPALREADVGIAMGASGSDVAREAADLVLLDDHFGTIVAAVQLGRATFANARRFLAFHLTDNVAELAPFAAWALSGGDFPLAIGVLQVLALDIGTDMLPALALGVEPASPRVMRGRPRSHRLIDRRLLVRALAVRGPVEAVAALIAATVVLSAGGWSWGASASPALLAVASGAVFATIALAQMANAFACRSDVLPVWRLAPFGNPALVGAVVVELVLLVGFLGIPLLQDLLGGAWPPPLGWLCAALGAVSLVLADAAHKAAAHRLHRK